MKFKTVKSISFSLLLLLLIPWQTAIAKAEYSNPILKVLLFKTNKPILISAQEGLSSDKVRFTPEASLKIEIAPTKKNNQILINGFSIKANRIFFDSKGPIQVTRPQTRFKRRYSGSIELIVFKGGFHVINHLPVESYLEGVLNAEISTKWPIEVVKAQSVISRTFALYKREQNLKRSWHVSSSHYDQVYKGLNISDKRGNYAIETTRGLVVSYKGNLALTFYHSNCGGVTEDPAMLWKSSFPYLNIRQVPYGQSDPKYNWQTKLDMQDVLKILKRSGLKIDQVYDLSIQKYSPSGRAKILQFNGNPALTLEAKKFRQKAGYKRIQSLLFEVIRVPGGFYFKGRGNGHGVGLSQWSAKEMAERGFTYNEILNFFYRNTQLASYRG